jgi:hypothetical protein
MPHARALVHKVCEVGWPAASRRTCGWLACRCGPHDGWSALAPISLLWLVVACTWQPEHAGSSREKRGWLLQHPVEVARPAAVALVPWLAVAARPLGPADMSVQLAGACAPVAAVHAVVVRPGSLVSCPGIACRHCSQPSKRSLPDDQTGLGCGLGVNGTGALAAAAVGLTADSLQQGCTGCICSQACSKAHAYCTGPQQAASPEGITDV